MLIKKIAPARLVIGLIAALLAILSLVYSFLGNAAICGAWSEDDGYERLEISPFGSFKVSVTGFALTGTYSISGDTLSVSLEGMNNSYQYKIVGNSLILSDGYREDSYTREGIAYMQLGALALSVILLGAGAFVIFIGMKNTGGPAPAYSSHTATYTPPVKPEATYTPPVKPEATYTPPVKPEATYTPPVKPEATYTPPVKPEVTYTPPVKPEATYTPPVKPEATYTPPVKPEETYTPPTEFAEPSTSSGFVSTFKPRKTSAESNNGGSEFFSSGADL